MTVNDRIEKFTKAQLEAAVLVLESLDTKGWADEIEEYGLCGAAHEVDVLLEFVKKVRTEKG